MSYYIIVFMLCSYNNTKVKCDITHSQEIFQSMEECHYSNGLYIVPGQCVPVSLGE
jgi:hypothetical protein